MTNESSLKKVALLRSFFFTRTDKVAAKMPWGKPHPIEGGDNLDGLLLAHVLGDAGPKGKARYGNRKGSTKVESGHYRIGSYTPNKEGLTRWLCLDFDGGADHADSLADPQSAALTTMHTCEALGLPAYLERSGGGCGFHVWVFFEPSVSAKEARQLGFAIAPKDAPLLAGSYADARRACGIEIFPKQDRIKKKSGYGNLVWLPWWSQAPDDANEFIRLEGEKLLPYLPDTFETVTAQRLAEILGSLLRQTDRQPVTLKDHVPDIVTVNMSGDDQNSAVRSYLESVKNEEAELPSSPSQTEEEEVQIRSALDVLDPDCHYDTWLQLGMALHTWDTGERGFALWDEWSRRGAKYQDGVTLEKWQSFTSEGGLRLGTLFRAAQQAGWQAPQRERAAASIGPPLKLSRKLLPEIVVNNRQFRDVTTDAWSALHAANKPPSLFVRMGGLVRVAENYVEDRLVRQIENLSEMALYDRLSRTADWVRHTDDGVFSVNPPKDVARVMSAVPDPRLPPLSALAEGPVFARDGSLIATPGYHQEAALWLDLPEGFFIGDIPDNPMPADISWARSLLLDDLFIDFPFVAASDRAHAVAALILPFVRRLIPGRTPIHLIEAPTEGSGKGYICHAISIIATGQTQGARTLSHDDDEARKMITSELSTGRPIILLDNADDKKKLNSPSLASVITADTWTDRQLGQSRMLTMPNNAVWLLTGNNPKLSMELARRCVRIRIEPPDERPHLRRSFKHDPFLDWVRENRGKLVRAVLILVRAWIAAGMPLSSHRLGSFERWAQIMGGVLDLSGIPGFLGNLEALYEAADVEGESWREFVSVWWEEYGEVPQRIVDLNNLCEFHNLMAAIRGDGSARSQQTRLGHALLSKRDRVYGNLQIARTGRNGKDKGTRYALHEIERGPDGHWIPKGQTGLFDHGGTFASRRNLENEVPPQGSASNIPLKSVGYDTRRNLAEPFSHPNARGGDTTTPHKKGSIYRYAHTQELPRVLADRPPKVPLGSANSATIEYHSGIHGGTFEPKVPPNLDEPPWDDLEPDPGDLDLASYEDEEVVG